MLYANNKARQDITWHPLMGKMKTALYVAIIPFLAGTSVISFYDIGYSDFQQESNDQGNTSSYFHFSQHMRIFQVNRIRVLFFSNLLFNSGYHTTHYTDVIMEAIASEVTSLTIVYSIVYSDTDQRKHQSTASLAFVRGIHRGPVNSPHKWPVTRKCFHLMTSSCLGNCVPESGIYETDK